MSLEQNKLSSYYWVPLLSFELLFTTVHQEPSHIGFTLWNGPGGVQSRPALPLPRLSKHLSSDHHLQTL